MTLPSLNLWSELLVWQIEALQHEECVILEAEAEVKARNLHPRGPNLHLTVLSILPLVFSNGRLHYDIFKADITMDNAFLVKPLESFCQVADALCNVLNS